MESGGFGRFRPRGSNPCVRTSKPLKSFIAVPPVLCLCLPEPSRPAPRRERRGRRGWRALTWPRLLQRLAGKHDLAALDIKNERSDLRSFVTNCLAEQNLVIAVATDN